MLPKTIRIKIRSGVPVMRRKKATRGRAVPADVRGGQRSVDGGVVHSDLWSDAGYTFTG